MPIAVLYESDEWSSYKIVDEIKGFGAEVSAFNLKDEFDETVLKNFDLVVSRVFASSVFRGNEYALKQMPKVLDFVIKNDIPMINPPIAHSYEISKALSTKVLADAGISVPKVYGVFRKEQLVLGGDFDYPLIVKPDCGGRTNSTYIIKSESELKIEMQNAKELDYIVEEFNNPQYGFLTRVEVIGGECRLILKRSVNAEGLSGYNVGSVYEFYPEVSQKLKDTAVKAMELLSIETGSMDIIENDTGLYIIDINSVSNTSEDTIETFKFDLMKETARYIVRRYNKIKGA